MNGPLAVIEAVGATKCFGTLTAVDRLDLRVERGEVFGWLGPNGAGKTTTIRLLTDALRPTAGRVSVLGGDPGDPAIRSRIGYLPAELDIDPRYTATDLLEFYGALRGGLDRVRAGDLCDRFSLDPSRPAGELSTGNRRKIGVVQAFVHRPELVILDEPTSGLDPLLQHEFHELVRDAIDAGATVFLSSHVLPEVEALADRVGILRRGRLVEIAPVAELRDRARQRIDLHIAGDPDAAAAFIDVPGVVSCDVSSGVVHLIVEGSVDGVVKAAGTINVQRITTPDTDLEDVFRSYYEGGR